MRFLKPYQLFLNTMKETKGKRGRLLGLDVGDKYVGIAVSDPANQVASPLSVLVRTKTNVDLMASDFNLLISKFSLKGFVVGVPFDRQRVHSEAVLVKTFIDDLSRTEKLEGLQFTYWNECFTSKNVELLLKDLDINPVQSKTMLDKFAAVGILQGYLDFVNRKMKQEDKEELAK
ncbi:hypothetical protein QN277_028272 [Acacia crassicarpa]|uniref:YqgF/RNase H-like domain-containing protein n=1 Tax=Acacia crassicarpa TaxID=499986 RepID=A0AAE1J4G1_9FABA|nr:hypothetical protein QN277_028272 [Acacia crassicarpa]